MRVKLDNKDLAPKRAHATDAGLDIFAMHDGIVRAGQSASFHTGLHVELPRGCAGIILPKSGLMTKHDIISFWVVDESYRGEVMVHLFNLGSQDYQVHAGNKISQLLVIPVRYEQVEVSEELSSGERGNSGFGSTGL